MRRWQTRSAPSSARTGEAVVAQNLKQALAAYDAMQAHAGSVVEGGAIAATDYAMPEWVDLPFEAARIAAPDVFAPGTSVQVNTGVWRTLRPVIDYDLCIAAPGCAARFVRTAPFRCAPTAPPQIDYDHCKGCLICVTVCPPHAIRAVPEREAQQAEEMKGATGMKRQLLTGNAAAAWGARLAGVDYVLRSRSRPRPRSSRPWPTGSRLAPWTAGW